MGNIGWFILIYFLVGWVLDVLITAILVVILIYKDHKNDNDSCTECFNDTIDNIKESVNMVDDSGNGWFKAWLIGRLTWPIAIPTGLYHIWSAVKEAEVKKEES